MAAPTLFLSRLIGVAALILSAAMFVGKAPMLAVIEQISSDRGSMFLLGFAGIVAGLAIVLTHNLWTKGLWPLVVTLCGWLILLRGVLIVLLPPELIKDAIAAVHYPEYFYVYAAIPLILGAYLSYRGFTARPAPAPTRAAPAPPAAAKPQSGGNRRPRRRR